MYYSNDPVRDAERREADWDEELENYPDCDNCGCKITSDKLWHIEGELYCEDCAEREFKEWTEKYMKQKGRI